MRWQLGITTVRERNTILSRTFMALYRGGFNEFAIFNDDERPHGRLEVTGNWLASLIELYLRNPRADRYAIVQDDMTCGINLKPYLDQCEFPAQGYWNLYTTYENEDVISGTKPGWMPGACLKDGEINTGRGAVFLVFDRVGLCTLLSQPSIWQSLQHARNGWKGIDGKVAEAMRAAGWREYVHNPSLVQHTGNALYGEESSITSEDPKTGKPIKKVWRPAVSYRGDEFDYMALCR